jgi:hypothetical protein
LAKPARQGRTRSPSRFLLFEQAWVLTGGVMASHKTSGFMGAMKKADLKGLGQGVNFP